MLTHTPNAKLYLCGDLNQYDFSFLSTDFDLNNIVDFPTFRNNILDIFYCNTSRKNSAVIDNFRSICAPPLGFAVHSHNVIFISKNVDCTNSYLFQKVFDLRKSHLEAFTKCIENTDWLPVSSSTMFLTL